MHSRRDRVVHLIRLDDFVDQERGVGFAGLPLASGEDRLARGAIADRSGQT